MSQRQPSNKETVLAAIQWKSYVTSRELAELSGVSPDTCHKRLPELERDGLVVKCGSRTCVITGRKAVVWRAT